jgi:hypothetical protein
MVEIVLTIGMLTGLAATLAISATLFGIAIGRLGG